MSTCTNVYHRVESQACSFSYNKFNNNCYKDALITRWISISTISLAKMYMFQSTNIHFNWVNKFPSQSTHFDENIIYFQLNQLAHQLHRWLRHLLCAGLHGQHPGIRWQQKTKTRFFEKFNIGSINKRECTQGLKVEDVGMEGEGLVFIVYRWQDL